MSHNHRNSPIDRYRMHHI
ncbi:hypothetical protein F383_06071 [Gossypium arboreum]|uniref:Uncharacterized protein n=1 Tax=Gossypium arboreum TaxID=29729 RepID=A0A0B0P6S8_GOSAR|nr:hypothetical protein F383_06071 [Gossypium arboreum]